MTDVGAEVKRGFLLMPFRDELEHIRGIIVAAGRDSGVSIERADDIFRPGVVVDQVLEAIDAADVIIAVCTDRNPNVFFEMGWAWRNHDPILVAETTDDLPFDIQHLRAVLYGYNDRAGQELVSLRQRLATAIRDALAYPKMPRGHRYTEAPKSKIRASLRAGMIDKGKHNYAFEVVNNGNVDLRDVTIEFPPDASNWIVATNSFSSYPIAVLPAGQHERAIASVSGGALSVRVTLRGTTPTGAQVCKEQTLTIL